MYFLQYNDSELEKEGRLYYNKCLTREEEKSL